jgi:hypothetical protein
MSPERYDLRCGEAIPVGDPGLPQHGVVEMPVHPFLEGGMGGGGKEGGPEHTVRVPPERIRPDERADDLDPARDSEVRTRNFGRVEEGEGEHFGCPEHDHMVFVTIP